MKIRFVGTAYPMRGGIAQYIAILFNLLSKENELKIYSFKRQYPEFLFPGKTQFEEKEPENKIPDDKNEKCVDSINPINWIITGFKIRRDNPDIIFFKYWIPFFAPCYYTISFVAKLFRKTKVLFICDNIIPHEKRFGDNLLTKLAFSKVDYFVVQSKTVEKDLQLFINNKQKYIYTPHPIYDVFGEKIDKDRAKTFLNEKYSFDIKNEKVILFFGYIRRYKGLMNLLEAMPQIIEKYNVRLVAAGEFYEDSNPYYDKIEELGIKSSVNIVSDFIPDENVKYLFSACDCLVLPYNNATQSGIIQIAYHFDKPVIATDIGGLGEVIVDGKTGLLIPPKNIKAIWKTYINNLNLLIK